MSDLAAFLEARLSEDEAAARAADSGPWKVDDVGYPEHISGADGTDVVAGHLWGGSVFGCDADALHMVRWDPARVLRECEAKRQVLALHQIVQLSPKGTVGCKWCHDYDGNGWLRGEGFCDTLRALALLHADHEDYSDEWRIHWPNHAADYPNWPVE